MLKLENKLFFLLITVLFFSCSDETKNINDINTQYKTKSISVVANEYNTIYSLANDSINAWKQNKLFYYSEVKGKSEYVLDSLLCFNNQGNRFVSALLAKALVTDATMDALRYFYGAKINGNWYFFDGPTVVLPRGMYQKDIHTPLSFAKMHEIALKEVFGGYLFNNGQINENYFKGEFEDSGWGVTSGKKEDFEKVYLQKVANNWYGVKRDTAQKKLP